jgi:hypothetical protein
LGSIALGLQRHSDMPSTSVDGIDVHIERKADGAIWLRYHVEAPSNAIVLPDHVVAARKDGLWQSTCCELFVRQAEASEYVEFNFSPSSCWAAYHFDEYRLGIEEQAIVAAPAIHLDASESHLALESEFVLPEQWRTAALEIGLSAVIEETDGTKSYWALAHPPGAPDFHHPDCFALTLPAPEQP